VPVIIARGLIAYARGMRPREAPVAQRMRDMKKIGEGREAEIFAWKPGAVLKLYRNPERVRSMEVERAAVTAARAASAPVPAALGSVQIDGRPGLILERADGLDLLTALDRRPWLLLGAGETMARCHAALHETRAPGVLPALKELVASALQRSPLIPTPFRDHALAAIERLPDEDRLCHGDFHPGNIIMAARGPVIIDWAGSTRGDPHADVALSLLLLKMGELPERAPPLIRALAGVGRRVIAARYLAAYRRLRPLDSALVRDWEIVVATHRLTADITPERHKLIALITSGMGDLASSLGSP
jgi:aminoglycoside phosphotransferase (APT) family kinase protein